MPGNITLHLSVRMAEVQKNTNNKYWCGCTEKWTLVQLVGMETGAATMENRIEVSGEGNGTPL